MYKVGQEVAFGSEENPIWGYIVGINIDPLEESEVKFESKTYTIRVFKKFYKDGYADFRRDESDLLDW